MAPKIAAKPLNTAPPLKPMGAEDVGPLAVKAEAAQVKADKARAELKTAHTAFTEAPAAKKPALQVKMDAAMNKAKAALSANDDAQAALGAAVKQIGTGSTPRAGVEKLAGELQKLDAEIGTKTQAFRDSTQQQVADTAAAGKLQKAGGPRYDAALKKAEASTRKTNLLSQQLGELKAARAPLSAELTRREGTTLTAAKQAGNAAATGVDDLEDLASKTRDQQIKAIGAPVEGVSAKQAANFDRKKVSMSVKSPGGPENAAKMLGEKLQGSDKDQQSLLIDAATGKTGETNHVATMAKAAQTSTSVAVPLADALLKTEGLARIALATEIAKSTPSMDGKLVETLTARMKGGTGFDETDALIQGLNKVNKPMAEKLRAVQFETITALREDFAEKNKVVAKLNGELGQLAMGFGPLLSPEKREAAILGFRNKHKAEYEAWDKAGAKLSNTLPYAMKNPEDRGVKEVIELLPAVMSTKDGEKALHLALAQQQAGEPTWLDQLPAAAAKAKDVSKLTTDLTTLVTKGVAQRALSLVKVGDLTGAQKVVDGLKANSKLFGVLPADMNGVVGSMKSVLAGGGQQAVDALKQDMAMLENSTTGFNGKGAQALKGMGVVFGVVGAIDGWGKLDKLDVAAQIKLMGDTLGMGVDGGMVAMDLFTKGGMKAFPRLDMLGKSLGGATAALGAVLDGVAAVQAFKEGKHAEGIASSASAVGGAIMATAMFSAAAGAQVVPVAGQIAGVVLVVAGTITKFATEEYRAGQEEDRIEGDAEAFLKGAGLSGDVLNHIADLRRKDGRNAGPAIQQLAVALGKDPKTFFEELQKLPIDKLEDFIDMAKDIPIGKDGKIPRSLPDDHVTMSPGKARAAEKHMAGIYLGPRSLNTALEYMRDEGMIPG